MKTFLLLTASPERSSNRSRWAFDLRLHCRPGLKRVAGSHLWTGRRLGADIVVREQRLLHAGPQAALSHH